jgi:hypothetical protein
MDRAETFKHEEIFGHEPQTGIDTNVTLTLTLPSVTIMLASREQSNSQSTSSRTAADFASDRQRSSGQPATAGASPATRPCRH